MSRRRNGMAEHRKHMSEDQVREVRQRIAGGQSERSIAVAMNVSRSSVNHIRRGVSFAEVK
jgi:FixJ family two-component response regulator